MEHPKQRRMSKARRMAWQKLRYYSFMAQREDEVEISLREKIPQAWHRLEHDIDVTEPKMKVTLRLDASVAKFYRAMGLGYQARINRILATYAQMKIADVLKEEQNGLDYMTEMARTKGEPPEDDVDPGPWE